MINLKTLTVKNFMSIGNVSQAVDFQKEHLTLVLGENLDMGGDNNGSRNGTGKSTILNALSYALYGVALTNIKKDNLINKINNKNMLVTLSFSKDGTEYRIERGRRPSILKFYVNNQEEETDDAQGDNRETQKDLSELMEMSHTMFKHIVALNTYAEPFLSMRAADQREIIEQLLGITLLSEKAEALKNAIKSTKEEIIKETAEIEAAKKSNDKIQSSINSLILKKTAWNSQKNIDIEKIRAAITELENIDIEDEIITHSSIKVYDELVKLLESLNKEKASLELALMQSEKTMFKYQNDLVQLKSKKCHACEQDLQDHKHKELTDDVLNNIAEIESYIKKINNDLKKSIKDISEIGDPGMRPETFYETESEAFQHQSNLNALSIQLESKINETDPYQEQIDELTNTAIQEISWDRVNELASLRDHQEFLLKLLVNKDSFIRKKIIDQNLSYLNNRLTYYLDKMGLPHSVVFLNDLSVEITQLGQDLDFDNLSRGERNRLILSLSWAFRDVWESLYQSINLLFVDELLDNGLDSSGVECGLSVLKKLTRERNKNVFLISHKDELVGRVNNILKVVKENGFTSYDFPEYME